MADQALRTAERTAKNEDTWQGWVDYSRTLARATGNQRDAQTVLYEAANSDREREDNHRPSVIEPTDYTFRLAVSFGLWGCGISDYAKLQRERLAELRRSRPFFVKANGRGQCDICGSYFIHGGIYEHEPTGEHILIGWICADKLELMSKEAFRAKKVTLGNYSAYSARVKHWKALRVALTNLPPEVRRALKVDHNITKDIRARFNRWLNISPAQTQLILKLAREASEPKPKKEEEKHVPAPEGRMQFQGTVVSLKERDSDYGPTWKVTIKVETPEGTWLAWGTCPAAILEEVERGDTIQLTATLKQGRDAHFALMGRPSKASIL